MANIFVTGANGFLGTHLVDELAKKGHHVIPMIHGKTSLRYIADANVRGFASATIGSVEDLALLKKILVEEKIELVYHLAAQAIVNTATKFPTETFETNIRGTWNVLEACRLADVRGVVVASSDKCYGQPLHVPITEEHPLNGDGIYDASKACADILARSYGKTYGLPVAIARCSNIYGPDDLNFSRIIPSIIKDILTGKDIEIRSNGTPTRDYIHVSDVVSGYEALGMFTMHNHHNPGAFNLGTGRPISVMELVELLVSISVPYISRVNIKYLNSERPSIQEQYLNSRKAKDVLGWEAKVKLEDGLKETLEWYVTHDEVWR